MGERGDLFPLYRKDDNDISNDVTYISLLGSIHKDEM